ncbi:hypothetical protein FHS29_003975 [Saccharothrix tamanrassetensis]|uniref:Uncharacterized protein n=1 Tax=Saccharothrix tamanrassetensis TaxID=1051531 RepID=A0A841CJY4_9PSEU|nr:hypothetical protein [Saccharothrix tamanrassetensis]MBB5957380.1 hypothetical protein [Saccharothrix tamanrassetensis]
MTTYRTTSDEAVIIELDPRGNPMLLEENLARSRMHDAEVFARRQRMAHRLVVARRWRRLAGWAERRARLKARAL